MKVLVVLVLAVFTGCNANLLYADKPSSKLDGLNDAFWGYVESTGRASDKILTVIGETEFGKALSARLEEGAKWAESYMDFAWDQLPDETAENINKLSLMFGLYSGTLVDHGMTIFKKQFVPLVERLAPIGEQVAITLIVRAEQLRDLASPYAERLREKLEPHLNALYQSTVKTN